MWHASFDARLQAWNQLRDQCRYLPTESCLESINSWWFQVPWRPYYLHWDDIDTWPDPWQLLSDNHYCDVARGLGMLYTITLLDRPDLASTTLVLTQDDCNLVLIEGSKYILNWKSNSILNTNLAIDIKKQHTQWRVKQQYP